MLLSIRPLLAFLFLTLVATQNQPFAISSLQYPDSFHCFIKMDRNLSIQIYSSQFSPNLLQLQTKDNNQQILISPSIDPLNLLYNSKSSQRNSMGYIVYLKKDETAAKKTHFRYAKVRLNDTWIEYLMPTLYQEMRALRLDQLYKCSNILISVNWIGNNAEIWKFSQNVQWLHIDDLQGGNVYRDNNVLYGYAVDQNQEQPIKIRVNYDEFCLLDRSTQPLKMDFNWTHKDQYSVSQLLELMKENVKLLNKQMISQQL